MELSRISLSPGLRYKQMLCGVYKHLCDEVSHSLGADSTCKSLCRCFSCGPDTPRLPPGAGKDSLAAWPYKAYPKHRYGKRAVPWGRVQHHLIEYMVNRVQGTCEPVQLRVPSP